MKNKLTAALFALVTTFGLVFGIAGCGEAAKVPDGGGINPGPSDVPADGPQDEQNGGTTTPDNGNGEEQKPEEHKHSYTAENVCSVCGEKWEYTEGLEYTPDKKTDTYIVTGIGTASGNVVLPYGHEGKSVTAIGDHAFYDCKKLTGITIPDSVTALGKCNNRDLQGVETINSSPIVKGVFEGCSGLKSITIGKGLTEIGERAFYGCTGWTGDLKIPDSVTLVGPKAFYGCKGLTSVTIGNGVTAIEESTFGNCAGLTSVTIGNGVTVIGKNAFSMCTKLESVTLENSVASIEDDAFFACYKLTDFIFHGTKEEWKKIGKAGSWITKTGYNVECNDGTETN